jgi:hypothetical protein
LPIIALASAVALFVLYSLARGDDAARVREPVERLKNALVYDSARESPGERNARLERELEIVLDPDVLVSIPEAGVLSGRASVAKFATDVHGLQRLFLGLSDVVVSFDGKKQTAQLTARITVDSSSSGHESHEVRNASMRLVHGEKGWSISSVTVASRTHEEPEARP